MLKALYDYAVRERLTLPPGYVNKTIKAYISLYADGRFLGIEMGDELPVPCPDIGSLANGTDKSNVLVEKSSLVLPESENAKSTFFLKALVDAGRYEPAWALCAAALQHEETRQMIRQELSRLKIKPADRISFRVDGRTLLETESVIAWWQDFRKQFQKGDSKGSARCIITGELCTPVATTNPINGLHAVGGHARGDALICFDKAAFCSYDLKQAANAPVSEQAMSAVKAALEALLKDSPIVAGMKFVHWYDSHPEEKDDPCSSLILGNEDMFFFDDDDSAADDDAADERNALQEREKATRLVRSIKSGSEETTLLSSNYYILLLTGVGGRVMIRRYERGRYSELHERMRQWYDDLRLSDLTGNGPVKPYKLNARLIRLLKRQKGSTDDRERLAKELSGVTPAILTAILSGSQLPEAVLVRSLSFIRSQMLDTDDNNLQIPDAIACQWLKVYLCRKERQQGEVMTMPYINPNHPIKAYHFGRMVAVYARIQEAALGDVNAGIIERFYASASQTPALVLGTLSRLSNHHFAKISNPGAARRLAAALEETAVAVGDDIPVTLTLEEQAYFALGYRQQCAEMNRQKAEAAAAKAARKYDGSDEQKSTETTLAEEEA